LLQSGPTPFVDQGEVSLHLLASLSETLLELPREALHGRGRGSRGHLRGGGLYLCLGGPDRLFRPPDVAAGD
jgi:hypothetical protein